MTHQDEREQMMGVRAELWPVGAAAGCLWLLSGVNGLQSGPIPVRMSVEDVVASLGRSIGLMPPEDGGSLVMVHGTSCRDEYGNLVVTHVAVVDCPDVMSHWPAAEPITIDALREVGKPDTHSATAAPEAIRYVDVLAHAIRHLAWLLDNDATAAEAMPAAVAEALRGLGPDLFAMYDRPHRPHGVRQAA